MTGIPKSKRTGGPRTKTGIAKTSRNAIKSGVYSSLVVLPGESEDEFRKLELQFQADFQVKGVVEAAMVHELSVLAWKKMRLERLERQHFMNELARDPAGFEFASVGFVYPETAEDYLTDPEEMEGFDVEEYRSVYAHLDQLLKDQITPKLLLAFKKAHPGFFDDLVDDADRMGFGRLSLDEMCAAVCELKDQRMPLMRYLIGELWGSVRPIVWLMNHEAEILAAKEKIRDKRLLKLMQQEGVNRVHEDLARSFSRTLGELRKQQAWRRKFQVVDVTPTPDSQIDTHPLNHTLTAS
jgi:hypothetical protein